LKDYIDRFMPQIPQRGGIAWNALFDFIIARASAALRAYPHTAFANAKAKPITTAMVRVMACAATNVTIARENFIIK